MRGKPKQQKVKSEGAWLGGHNAPTLVDDPRLRKTLESAAESGNSPSTPPSLPPPHLRPASNPGVTWHTQSDGTVSLQTPRPARNPGRFGRQAALALQGIQPRSDQNPRISKGPTISINSDIARTGRLDADDQAQRRLDDCHNMTTPECFVKVRIHLSY